MIDLKVIVYQTSARGETEFADILDNYIRELRANNWNLLFEYDTYDTEKSEILKKPIFINRMTFMRII